MKKIYDIVSMAILLFCTAACSDSYLELSPESSVSDEVIFENADAAQYAVNGLGRIMSTQYLDTQGYNGSGRISWRCDTERQLHRLAESRERQLFYQQYEQQHPCNMVLLLQTHQKC